MTAKLTSEQSNTLFLSYQQGDNNALDALFRQWHPYVKKRVRKSNAFPAYEIDDIASEVWLLVQKDRLKWDVDRAGWWKFLDYRIRQAISHARSKRSALKRQADHNTAALDDPDTHHEPIADHAPAVIDLMIFQERLQLVTDVIKQCGFTEQVRVILELKLADEPHGVIAERVGMERSAVSTALGRAVRRIRNVLRNQNRL